MDIWFRNDRAASRKEESGVASVRNFLVATYRNPTGIRQKGIKGIYWLSGSKDNQTAGRGGLLGFRDKWGEGHASLGALPALISPLLSGRHILPLGFLLSLQTIFPPQAGFWPLNAVSLASSDFCCWT